MKERITKSDVCACCHWPSDLKVYDLMPGEPTILCIVCASTQAGNMATFPRQYDSGVRDLAGIIGYCTNLILDALKERKA